MKIEIKTDSYNDRRYGKPWIATVNFANGSAGEFQFGEWCGQASCSGLLLIDCDVGDIIARGQKDHRKPSNSAANYYIVQADGTLQSTSKPGAYQHYQSVKIVEETSTNPLTPYTTDELLAELVRRGVEVPHA